MSASGYIAIAAAGCGEDLTFWVLNQQQMDDVDALASGGGNYEDAMNEIIERDDLWDKVNFGTIKDALAYMGSEDMDLVEDFSYIQS